MSCESQEALEFDDAMSSWSSAFDPITSPPQSPENRPKGKMKKKKSAKKKRDTRHKMRKKEKKKPRGASSSAAGPAGGAQHTAPRGRSGPATPEMECEKMECNARHLLPLRLALAGGFFRLSGSPQGTHSCQSRLPSGRAAAKMLVRAGLRCKCHFALIADCPLSRQNQVRDSVHVAQFN